MRVAAHFPRPRSNSGLAFRLYARIQLSDPAAMSNEDGFDRMARAAIRAHRLTALHGTPMMQLLSRLLLLEIGLEIAAKREAGAANDNPETSDASADD
jgi:hypothetical protein